MDLNVGPFKKDHIEKKGVAKMCMLRWMPGYTLRVKFKMRIFEERIKVQTLRLKQYRLCWLWLVQSWPEDALIRKVKSWGDGDCRSKSREAKEDSDCGS